MPAEAIDAPVLDANPVEQQTTQDAVEHAVDDTPVQPQEQQQEITGDMRTLPAAIKALQAANNPAYQEARNNFFALRALREKVKDFDVEGTRAWLEENGGRDGIEMSRTEAQSKAQQFEGIQEAMRNGDTRLIDELVQNSPEGFAKLAPAMAERWAQADPEGWQGAMSGIFAATIAQSGVMNLLDRMSMRLQYGDTQNLAAELKSLQDWANSFGQQRPQQQQAPGQGRTAPGQQQQGEAAWQKEKREFEEKQFQTSFNNDLGSWRQNTIEAALKEYSERQPENKTALEIATREVSRQLDERMRKDKDFMGKVEALTGRKDKSGALKLVQSREKTAIDEIAQAVGRGIFGNPKPKTEPKPEAKAAPVRTGTPKKEDPFDSIFAR